MELGSFNTQGLPRIGLAASCSFSLFLCSYVLIRPPFPLPDSLCGLYHP
ncbi:hypothetical protein E2C01_064198 [Portunus trituberculatus]|uniref:Uncharacterized protein n=1 Tax=Portunus trituberculatus TaxID=210409 RepID=A0A5B7HK62_PORTR|nr:hypothetical protein [Portunus trituberculatus]